MPDAINLTDQVAAAAQQSGGINWDWYIVFLVIAVIIFIAVLWKIRQAFSGFFVEFKGIDGARMEHFGDSAKVAADVIKDGNNLYKVMDSPTLFLYWRFFRVPKYYVDERYPFTTNFIEKKDGTEAADRRVSPAELNIVVSGKAFEKLQTITEKGEKGPMILVAGACLAIGIMIGSMVL
jgi:hypothetical protein